MPTPFAKPAAPLGLPASSDTTPPLETSTRQLCCSPPYTVLPSADSAQPKEAEIMEFATGCGRAARPQMLFPITVATAPVAMCRVRTRQPVPMLHRDMHSMAPLADRPSAAPCTPVAMVVTPTLASTYRIASFPRSPMYTLPAGETARPVRSRSRAPCAYPCGTSKYPGSSSTPARSTVPGAGGVIMRSR